MKMNVKIVLMKIVSITILLSCTVTGRSKHPKLKSVVAAQSHSAGPRSLVMPDEDFIPTNDVSPRYVKLLYAALFKDYQKELRPVKNESETLKVSLQLWLKQILKIKEKDQTVMVYCWLELIRYSICKVHFIAAHQMYDSNIKTKESFLQYWRDEFLNWNPSDFGGIDSIHVPAHRIWKPDILVYNSATMNIKENELETYAILTNTGDITLFRSMITDITCDFSMRLREFPFDKQICFLTFSSWSFDGSKIRLTAVNGTDNLELYIHNTEWHLLDFKHKTYVKKYDCCPNPFIDITYFVALKRSPSYYIFSLVIPSAFITVVTIFGFFTPHSTTGENTEKLSLGVTAVMSTAIIMMMVSDNVPVTADVIPLIAKYYIGLIFIIVAAALSTTFTLAFQMRGNLGHRMSAVMRSLLFDKLANQSMLSWMFVLQVVPPAKRSKRLDKPSFAFENTSNMCRDDSLSSRVSLTREDGPRFIQMNHLSNEAVPPFHASSLDCENTCCASHTLKRLFECIHSIEQAILTQHEQRAIKIEWEQGTRILERLIMLIFILITCIFAVYMLNGHDEDIKLTDELMDKTKFQ